jgi:hypothetical protein
MGPSRLLFLRLRIVTLWALQKGTRADIWTLRANSKKHLTSHLGNRTSKRSPLPGWLGDPGDYLKKQRTSRANPAITRSPAAARLLIIIIEKILWTIEREN